MTDAGHNVKATADAGFERNPRLWASPHDQPKRQRCGSCPTKKKHRSVFKQNVACSFETLPV